MSRLRRRSQVPSGPPPSERKRIHEARKNTHQTTTNKKTKSSTRVRNHHRKSERRMRARETKSEGDTQCAKKTAPIRGARRRQRTMCIAYEAAPAGFAGRRLSTPRYRDAAPTQNKQRWKHLQGQRPSVCVRRHETLYPFTLEVSSRTQVVHDSVVVPTPSLQRGGSPPHRPLRV